MTEKKRVKKKLLKVSIVLYVLIIALVGVYSLAWFITNKRVEIGVNEEIKIAVGNNLEFAWITDVNGTPEWRSKVSILPEGNKNYPDVSAGSVDENGKLNFYYPTVLDENDNVLNDVEHLRKLTGEEGYYIELRLRFRTSVNMGVYLSNKSFISPIDTEKKDSTYGQISTDYIAGAARVSFSEVIETDEEGNVTKEELKNVWVPNDKVELSYIDQTVTVDNKEVLIKKAELKSDGERERFYRDGDIEESASDYNLPYGYLDIENGKIVEKAYSEEDYCSKKVTVGNKDLATDESGIPVINGAKELLTFTAHDGEIQEKDLVVRIWFEGTDREADKALNGGRVNYNLQFIGIDKMEATESETKLGGLTWKNDKLYFGETEATTNDNVFYSMNGIDWYPYNETGTTNSELSQTTKNYVYVKIRETGETKETSVRKLIKTS